MVSTSSLSGTRTIGTIGTEGFLVAPVRLACGTWSTSDGRQHSALAARIVEHFCPRPVPPRRKPVSRTPPAASSCTDTCRGRCPGSCGSPNGGSAFAFSRINSVRSLSATASWVRIRLTAVQRWPELLGGPGQGNRGGFFQILASDPGRRSMISGSLPPSSSTVRVCSQPYAGNHLADRSRRR